MKKFLTLSTTLLILITSQENSEAKTLSEMKEALLSFVKGGCRSPASSTKSEEVSLRSAFPHRASITFVDPFQGTISPRDKQAYLLREVFQGTISPRNKKESLLRKIEKIIEAERSSKPLEMLRIEEGMKELNEMGFSSGAAVITGMLP